MRSALLNTLIITIFLLSIVAPLVPAVKPTTSIAKAQSTDGLQITVNTTKATYGSVIEFNVTLLNVNSYGDNITVNITINGQLNKDVVVNLTSATGSYGLYNATYTGYLKIQSDGKVLYWSTGSPRLLVGQLTADGQTIVISRDGVSVTVTFYATTKLIIKGREYPAGSNIYWLPMLCCGVQNRYDALNEWEIIAPAATQSQYQVNISIKDATGKVLHYEIVTFNNTNGVLVPANASEAQKIRWLLGNVSEQILPWYINGVDFNDIIREGDMLTINATILGLGGTALANLRFFVSIAKIYTEPATLSLNNPSFTIYVEDADANFDTQAAETYPYNLTIEGMTVTLTETGKNTGVFEAKVNLLTDGLYPTIFNETDNTLYWKLNETRIDNCGGTCVCERAGVWTITYHTAQVETLEKSVILRSDTTCCPVLKLTLKIHDQDLLLGYPSTVPVATVRISAGQNIANVTAYYYDATTSQTLSVPALMFSIYLVGENSENETMAANLTAIQAFTVSFYQVSADTVQAQIPLDLLDWGTANAELSSAGYKAKYLEVVYYDLFNPNLTIIKKVIKVPIQYVKIEVDRNTLPIPARIYYGGTDLCPSGVCGTYTYVNGTMYQTVHVTIYDNGSNKQCCFKDTIPATSVKLTLVKEDSDGNVLFNISDYGSLTIELKKRHTDGTYETIGTCYIELTNLEETGVNTGEFKGELHIWSEIYTSSGTVIVPGCPSPWLNGAKLTLSYTSPSIGYDEKTITFKVEDAKLYVNATGPVTFGTEVNITVVDPDANLDNNVVEKVPVIIGFYCPTSGEIIGQKYIWLEETAANSSVFTGTLVIDENLEAKIGSQTIPACTCGSQLKTQPCTELHIFYIDPTPYDATSLKQADRYLVNWIAENGGMTPDWLLYYSSSYTPASEDAVSFAPASKAVHEATITVIPKVGSVELYYDVPVLNIGWIKVAENMENKNITEGVVPAAYNVGLKLVVIDPDQNRDATVNDTISGSRILITFGNVSVKLSSIGYDLYETGESTGVFETELSLGDIVTALQTKLPDLTLDDLVGKTITITYFDSSASCQTGACGTATAQVSISFKVIDITGNLTIVDATTGKPKSVYSCACPETNTPGDYIDIRIADVSLLDYAGPGGSIAFNDYFEVYDVTTGTRAPVTDYSIGPLVYVDYYNVTINGIPIPVPVFETQPAVKLACTILGTSGATNYIVTGPRAIIQIAYEDPHGDNGTATEVAKNINVGTAGVAKPEETAYINTSKIDVRVYRNGTYVQSAIVVQGEPVTLEVPINYNPVAASTYAGQTFQVLYLVTDDSGHVYAFGYVPVSVTQSGFVVVPLQISSLVTQSLQPGTYKVVIMVVNNLTDLVSLSKPVEVTITVQAA